MSLFCIDSSFSKFVSGSKAGIKMRIADTKCLKELTNFSTATNLQTFLVGTNLFAHCWNSVCYNDHFQLYGEGETPSLDSVNSTTEDRCSRGDAGKWRHREKSCRHQPQRRELAKTVASNVGRINLGLWLQMTKWRILFFGSLLCFFFLLIVQFSHIIYFILYCRQNFKCKSCESL